MKQTECPAAPNQAPTEHDIQRTLQQPVLSPPNRS